MLCLSCQQNIPDAAGVCPVCGSPVSAVTQTSALPVGTKLQAGAFTVGRVLGQGGFGITYLGSHQRLRRPVAIKEFFVWGSVRRGVAVLSSGSIGADYHNMKARFLDEARTWAQMQHSGIVRVYDAFEENNTAYLVMEYLKGRTLLKVLEGQGPLEETAAVRYIERAGEALEYLHRQGWLHRDVKPDNIIVCDDGRVVLAGLDAIMRLDAETPERVVTSDIILTPGYAPLEQYTGKARLGPFTDVYALGATLYHLLTGVVPVEATNRAGGTGLPPVRQLRPEVSEQMANTVMAALAIRIQVRSQTVRGEFLATLSGGV